MWLRSAPEVPEISSEMGNLCTPLARAEMATAGQEIGCTVSVRVCVVVVIPVAACAWCSQLRYRSSLPVCSILLDQKIFNIATTR